MSVVFTAKDHAYNSIDQINPVKWISVTRFISEFHEKFDPIATSEKCTKNRKSKWYGIPPETIREIWDRESKRASDSGDWYHNEQEKEYSDQISVSREGKQIPIFRPIIDGDLKFAPDQTLKEGIYPEHFVYLKSAGICGQSDRVEVINNLVNITDYKSNKEIKTSGFKNWQGITKKMTGPVSHLDDCNLNTYALQVSTYLYIILKHNPQLKPGKLELQHITFQVESTDKFGFPIAKLVDNKPVVDKITNYPIPYLRNEVMAMIKYFTDKNEFSF